MGRALTAAQIYQLARGAGFTGTAAVTATAIALAESGGIPDNVGDRNLTTAGEQSTGLWQINYRPSRDHADPVRDPQANLDPATNARNAYLISGQGRNFGPWSTYTSGAYRSHLPAALAAAGGGTGVAALPASQFAGAGTSSTGSGSSSSGSTGPDLNPFTSGGGGLLGAVFGNVVGGIGHLVLPTVFVLGGVVLVVGGVYKAATGRSGGARPIPIPIPI